MNLATPATRTLTFQFGTAFNLRAGFATAFLACLSVGCSHDDTPDLSEVTGTLMKSGKPVADAQVEFYPTTVGAASYGKTDEQGKFVLRYSTGKPGAAVDKHTVTVIGGRVDGERGGGLVLPEMLAGEDAVEGTLEPIGLQKKGKRNSGGPETVEGLTAEVLASGPNHIELNI